MRSVCYRDSSLSESFLRDLSNSSAVVSVTFSVHISCRMSRLLSNFLLSSSFITLEIALAVPYLVRLSFTSFS